MGLRKKIKEQDKLIASLKETLIDLTFRLCNIEKAYFGRITEVEKTADNVEKKIEDLYKDIEKRLLNLDNDDKSAHKKIPTIADIVGEWVYGEDKDE